MALIEPLATVLICTHNRAALLSAALASLSRVRSAIPWELVLVDNASTDGTSRVAADHAASFPVPLRYVYEPGLGKSRALNTGIEAATGRFIVFGDDDQQFADDWIEQSCSPLLADGSIDYTGGPVRPLLSSPLPPWFDVTRAELRAPLGLFDYGSEAFIFEDRQRVAGGGNMAVRRALLDRIGRFREDLGRRGRSLLGQEQAEFFSRSRAAGARGCFVPGMVVWHHIPPERLRRRYFLRWWYWKGVAHARWHALAGLTENGLNVAEAPRVTGVPRFVYGESARAVARAIMSRVRWADPATRFLPLLRLAYLAGYASEARRRRRAQGAPESVFDLQPSRET